MSYRTVVCEGELMELKKKIVWVIIVISASYLYGEMKSNAGYYKGLHVGYVQAALAKVGAKGR